MLVLKVVLLEVLVALVVEIRLGHAVALPNVDRLAPATNAELLLKVLLLICY